MSEHDRDPVLVVGFGIAGALVCWFLQKHNIKYVVVDDAAPGSSSPVAAGLINPLAGRSLALAHEVDRFLPFARHTYQQLGDFLGLTCWADREFWTLLRDEQERKLWQTRVMDPAVQAYLEAADLEKPVPPHALAEAGVVRVRGGGQVAFTPLLQSFAAQLERQGSLLRQPFHYNALVWGNTTGSKTDHWTYMDQSWSAVLFCEGYRVRYNPWFSHLPWRVNRGQRLLVKLPGLMVQPPGEQAVWRKQALLAPLGENQFWLGSVNDWDQESPEPTKSAELALLTMLSQMTDVPFQEVQAASGIRPVVRDRKPVAGFHAQHPSLGLLNGLGTKGALLGPWYASALVAGLANAFGLEGRDNASNDHPDWQASLGGVSPNRFAR